MKKFNKPSINLLKKLIKSKETIKNVLSFLKEIKKLHGPETDYDINLNDPESRFMKNKKRHKLLQLQFTSSNRR